MRVLGLITARAGSKGLPGKNLRPLQGLPLLAWTCEAARRATSLSRVILSTDGEDIAACGRACGVEVPFLRPAELAADKTPSIDVALHAVRWLRQHEGWDADVLVLLQPTSPLRTAQHINEAMALLGPEVSTVVSVVRLPHRFSPYSVMRVEAGRLVDFVPGPLPFDRFRRQEHPAVFARNGPAVLVNRVPELERARSFYGPVVVPYEMDEPSSVDIDDAEDLQEAERRLAQKEAR
ncbi:MAG: acylneuraminate cytidylyltransferase family protein [Deltaproteobacteria bacterium]|nr:acylneuraminate cytidylyltransferase family protein [Deltaproteobacteria bacterium]